MHEYGRQPQIGYSEIDQAIEEAPDLFLQMLKDRGVTFTLPPGGLTIGETIDLCRFIVRKCTEQ